MSLGQPSGVGEKTLFLTIFHHFLELVPVSGAPELPEDRDRDRHRDWDRDFGIY